ncbi:MAG: Fe(3+) ABC transporter substrate-binding protein [Gammaproteobacteria bacterium]
MKQILGCIATLLIAQSLQAAEVNIYSARGEDLIKPALDRFTEETGIEVNLITESADALIRRIELEGNNSPADVLLTVDAGRLHRAKEAGLLQPIESDVLESRVPAFYRDPNDLWFGLSLRSRVIMYDRDSVSPDDISSYEDLADPRWRNEICIRSSSNIYNQSLVASMIAYHGMEATQEWAEGLVANFARPPQGGDRDQIRAVAAGQCQLAVANTYYLAGMITSGIEADVEVAKQIGVLWPNQDGRGAHMNVSGAGVLVNAPNRDSAVRLLEFLTGDFAQQWYAERNGEYPVRQDVDTSDVLKRFGDFKADNLGLEKLGEHNAEAVRLMDRAGWR